MKKYLAIAALALFAACSGSDKPAEEAKKDQPLAQSENNNRFNQSFGQLLNNYFHLKDALVLSSDSMAVNSAKLLKASADSLPLNELKADSSITLTAKDFLTSISSESEALTQEANIEGKRKSFQMISENLYTLLQTVRYDQAVVYHQFCPMAFDDAGAFWLSESSDIKNPYFGKKMLTCGEVKDSINFKAQ